MKIPSQDCWIITCFSLEKPENLGYARLLRFADQTQATSYSFQLLELIIFLTRGNAENA